MNLEPNVAKAIKNLADNKLRRQNRSPTNRRRRQPGFGAGSMGTAALFGNLSRCCRGMEMERQEENKQQNYRANTAAEMIPILYTDGEHGFEPSQKAKGLY